MYALLVHSTPTLAGRINWLANPTKGPKALAWSLVEGANMPPKPRLKSMRASIVGVLRARAEENRTPPPYHMYVDGDSGKALILVAGQWAGVF